MRACILILHWSFLIASVAYSQRLDSSARYGVFVNGALSYHVSNFQYIPDCPVCGAPFTSGSGFGVDFGGSYLLPLSPQLAMEFRLAYHDLGATLTNTEVTKVINQSDQLVDGSFVKTLNAKIGTIAISPLIAFHPSGGWRVLAGPTLGYVTSKSFEEKEEVSLPSNGVFVDSNGRAVGRVRNDYSGTIPGAAVILAGITIGGQYELPMNASGSLHLVPEAFFTYGITPIAQGMTWRANSVTAGVSIEYTPRKAEPPPLPPPHPPSPPPTPPRPEKPRLAAIAASLRVEGVELDQTVRPIKELVVEDYIRTQYRPLLNYIFFERGSSEMPVRYHKLTSHETRDYDFRRFYEYETLPLYYEALNIFGQRMREYPGGRLTIAGCNDGAEETAITGLSRSRAETVFAYLRDVWRIDPSRMKLQSRNLPQKPSSTSDTDGAQENRRVEITSNQWEVMEPMFTTDTAHVSKPAGLRFEPRAVAETGIARWQLDAEDADNMTSKKFGGSDTVPGMLDWDLQKENSEALGKLHSIQARLGITDRQGQEAHTEPVEIPVRHYTLLDKHREGSVDTIISRYNLILFDYNRSELSDANRRIADLVRSRTTAESKVKVLGFTDRIGSDEYNQKLSSSRAAATAQSINIQGKIQSLDVRGLGRSMLLYDNSLPEGRFYSRTVTVEVTTPTKQ